MRISFSDVFIKLQIACGQRGSLLIGINQ